MRNIKTHLLNRMASKHIAGSELKNAVDLCRNLNAKGFSATLGFWNKPDEKPENVLNKYLETVNSIADNKLNAQMAIKLHAVNYDKTMLEDVVKEAQKKDVCLHFDSHGLDAVEKTLEVVQWIRKSYYKIGCTLPSRFKRSLSDAKLLIDPGINIRVVKGHWTDPENDVDCRKNFIAIVNTLKGNHIHMAIATHDYMLAKKAIRCLTKSDTSFELEQLISLPLISRSIANQLNIPVRVYIPFGFPYLPYSIHYVKERPEIAFWIVKDMLLPKNNKINFTNI